IGMSFLYLFLFCIMGVITRGVLKVGRRWIQLLIGIVIALAVTYMHGLPILKGISFLVLGNIAYFRGVVSMEVDWERLFLRQMWWLALLFYMIGGFFYSRLVDFKEYMSYMMVGGAIQVPVSLIMLNIKQLGDATLMRDEKPIVPASIKRQNRILLFINLIVIIFIASFSIIKEFFKKVFTKLAIWIIQLLIALTSLFGGDEMPRTPDGGAAPALPIE